MKFKPKVALYYLRKKGKYPNASVEYVGKYLNIRYKLIKDCQAEWLIIDRRTARLLAKRILQCLKETQR